jgi:transcriptional regulator with XRE-family HTH domain
MDHVTLGRRVAQAREAADISQGKLGELVALDRTAINRAENGDRKLTMTEMIAIAAALRRPLAYFVNDPPPAVVNRRTALARAPEGTGALRHESSAVLDIELELFAADVRMLLEMTLLVPLVRDRDARTPRSHKDAEQSSRAGFGRSWGSVRIRSWTWAESANGWVSTRIRWLWVRTVQTEDASR